MRGLAPDFYTFLSNSTSSQQAVVKEVRANRGLRVDNFPELVAKVAMLSYRNPEYVLFFRGQDRDYRDDNELTDCYPQIFRVESGNRLRSAELRRRFEKLRRAERALIDALSSEALLGKTRLKRFDVLRWAVLQHYEVCETPLMDFTQSLRVACSFATEPQRHSSGGSVMVFGFPQVSGGVTASSDQGMQIIRLLSTCPPSAKRPYHQEGYLAGEFPSLTPELIGDFGRTELNFARRLLCKFRVHGGDDFWPKGYAPIPRAALFPDDIDKFEAIAVQVRKKLNTA